MLPLLLLWTTLASASGTPLRDHVRQITLPPTLRSLTAQGTLTRAEVVQKLGKPAKARGESRYFYNLSGINYDTSVSFDPKGRVTSVKYWVPAGKWKITAFAQWLTEDQVVPGLTAGRGAPTEFTGRGFKVRVAEQGVELGFAGMDSPWLESVTLWKAGGPGP